MSELQEVIDKQARAIELLTLYAQRLEAFHLPSDKTDPPHPIWQQLREILGDG